MTISIKSLGATAYSLMQAAEAQKDIPLEKLQRNTGVGETAFGLKSRRFIFVNCITCSHLLAVRRTLEPRPTTVRVNLSPQNVSRFGLKCKIY